MESSLKNNALGSLKQISPSQLLGETLFIQCISWNQSSGGEGGRGRGPS